MIVSNAVAADSPRPAQAEHSLPFGLFRTSLQKVEGLLLDRLQFVALAVAGLIVLVCCLTLMDGARQPSRDDNVTGSIVAQSRASAAPATEAWRAIRRPIEIVALQSAQTEKLPITYTMARKGNERRDQLSFGYFDDARQDLGIVLRRGEAPRPEALLVETVRHQAERGVSVRRAGRPEQLDSKFGPLDISDMQFVHESGMQKACLAFRSADWKSGIGIEGWYCAAPGAAAERPVLACFVDRLTLLRSGDDQVLRQFFQDAERRRQPCPPQAQSAARKPTWLDQDGKRPAIRGEDVTGSIAGKRGRSE